MQQVVWSERAIFSIQKIYDYIFDDSPQNAEMVVNTLLDLGESLADERFEYAKDPYNDNYRFVIKWNYKILYVRKKNSVRIIDVFSVKQDPKQLMQL